MDEFQPGRLKGSNDMLPNTAEPHGPPVPGKAPIIVQNGLMNQWPAHAEYHPDAGWHTVVYAFAETSVRPGLDLQFRPSDPSPEFVAQARCDYPGWAERIPNDKDRT